jgi:hypothetical protein
LAKNQVGDFCCVPIALSSVASVYKIYFISRLTSSALSIIALPGQ